MCRKCIIDILRKIIEQKKMKKNILKKFLKKKLFKKIIINT